MMARSDVVSLEIVQQPKNGLVTQEGKEKKARKPVDPPPIVRMRVNHAHDSTSNYLQSPYLFMTVHLASEPATADFEPPSKTLAGQTVSSLHRLKDPTNDDGAFFVFGDLSVRRTGTYVLCFSLWEMTKETFQVSMIKTVSSDYFTVYSAKEFPGLQESTYLSRAFSDQGVRLRLRKEPRAIAGNKRAYYSDSPPESQSRGGFGGGLPAQQYTMGPQTIKRQRSETADAGYMVQPMQPADPYRTGYNPTGSSTASFVGQPNTPSQPSIFGNRLPNQAQTSPAQTMDARRWPGHAVGSDTQSYRGSMDIANSYLAGQPTHGSNQYAVAPSHPMGHNAPGMSTPMSMSENHGMGSLQSRGYPTNPSPVGSAQPQYSQELNHASAYGQGIVPLDLQSPDETYSSTQQPTFAPPMASYSHHTHLPADQTSGYSSLASPGREAHLPLRSESGHAAMPTLNSSVYHQFPPQPGGPNQTPQYHTGSYTTPQHPSHTMHKYDGR
ncbi:hypothetical protein MBLNU230_g4582t1 [Neophaeotheca triangularis]